MQAGVFIVSYCLMTNHTHLLLVPKDETGLAKALKPLHMRYSQYLNYRFSRIGLNWQGRFSSAPLDAKHSVNALRYVAENPVRAGMVVRPEEYLWSSAKCHISGDPNPYITAPDRWLKKASQALTATGSALLCPHKCDQLRRATLMNLPVRDDSFIIGLERLAERQLFARSRGRPRKDKG
jgi:putative transposase